MDKRTVELMTEISSEELSKHSVYKNCWVAVEGSVYDISSYIDEHPGGDIILAGAGTDATVLFNHYHILNDARARAVLNKMKIGVLVGAKSPIMGTFYNTLKGKVAQKLAGVPSRPWHAVMLFVADTLNLFALIIAGVYVSYMGLASPLSTFLLTVLYHRKGVLSLSCDHAHAGVFKRLRECCTLCSSNMWKSLTECNGSPRSPSANPF